MVRISTSMMHTNALNAMMQRQSDLSRTQTEVATGKRVQKPSDDPNAAVQILQLEQTKAAATQYGANITAVNARLQLEEQGLSDSQAIVERLHELAVQANSSALSSSDRTSISTELQQLRAQLMSIANRKDTNGEYLFAGYATSTQPFVQDATGSVTYTGMQGVREVQVSASQYVADSDSGDHVFVAIPEGNGLFSMAAAAGNTGAGVINGTIQNAGAWVADDYTLSFTSATAWEIRDSSSTLVTSGAYVEGAAITFNGASITLTGKPASGDSFSIADSKSEDLFATIDKMVAALGDPQDTDAQKAQFLNQINASLTQLSQAEDHLLSVRTSVGVRMAMVESVDGARQDTLATVAVTLSSLRDSDYAEAVSRLSQQYTGLQAAQQSYAKIAQLSLFDFLR